MMRTALRLLAAAACLVTATTYAADAQPLIRSAKSGPWSAPQTWEGGKVPAAGSRVHVLAAHTVIYDVLSNDVIRAINVAGKLSFAKDKDTLLNVGLIKVEPNDVFSEEGFDCDHVSESIDPSKPRATLEVGSPLAPIAADKKAIIRLHFVEGHDAISCPAIVTCGGQMDFHGAPLAHTWMKLAATAKKGATEVTCSEAVTGWRIGDRIILTPGDADQDADGLTEERVITAIDGMALKFEQPLANDHWGEGEFRSEVANLSRNVLVESADPAGQRGHTMFHRGSAGAISYAEFRHLGKKDTLGRYSLHFHLCGSTMRGSSVIGASIWDSHNRWLTIHGTNYLVVRDNVGYKSVGHGYFLEDGTEVYNIFDHNLAVAARHGKRLPKQVLPFDQNEGAGFWWANSHNTFTRNVAADCDRYGFRYEATPTSALKLTFHILQPDGTEKETDIRTLPFVRFDGNEVHSSFGLYGINLGEGVRGVGPDAKHPFVLRNTKIWNVHYGLRPQAPSVLVENLTIKSHYGVYHPNYVNHVYRNVTIKGTNTEPFNRGHDDQSEQHGVLTVDGLTFEGCRSGGMPLIQISDQNATGQAESHFRGVKTVNWLDGRRQKSLVNLGGGPRPQPRTEKGVPIYLHDWYGPNRTAMVVSTRSPEYKASPSEYRDDAPLTGDESRVREVKDIDFPALLDPVDDLPPITVITHVAKQGDKLLVRGSATDNGEIKRVAVNGQAAQLDPASGAWQVELPSSTKELAAHSEDAAGNVEKLVHKVTVR